MIFSWSRFVEIAEYLKKQGDANQIPQEAAYRCSVSRAYYGAYAMPRTMQRIPGVMYRKPKAPIIDD